MATAKQAGGLYYIGETAVDANGVSIEGAPKRPKDTPPDQQPGAIGNPASDPVQRMADAITAALRGQAPASAAPAPASGDDEVTHPTLSDLPEHLAALTTVREVEQLRDTDDRKGAQRIYEARIAELQA